MITIPAAPPVPEAPAPTRAPVAAPTLRSVHLWTGALLVAAFLGTGQYMHLRYDHLRGMEDATRLLFRSSHIYILWAGLLNLVLGCYLAPRVTPWGRGMQRAGSALLLLAGALLVAAFFVEPTGAGMARPLTRPAIYAAFAGTLLHLLTSLRGRPRQA